LNTRRIERAHLERDGIRSAVRDAGHGAMLLSEQDTEESLKTALAERNNEEPVWVFGYGSLIGNPLMRFAQPRVARILGYHRGFYSWSQINHGSPETRTCTGASSRWLLWRYGLPAAR
jgi:cation transport protein ChaC